MRHRARARNIGRTSAHRSAMYRNLVTSLLEHERIETTDAKAKEVRRIADRMITLGKRGDLHARRRAMRVIRERDVAAKVFEDLADRYRNRPGGYTRVLKTRRRVGDAAAMSIVELVEPLETPKPEKKAQKKSDRKPKKAAGRKKAASRSEATEKKKTAKKPAAKTTKKKTTKKATTKKKTAKKATTKKAKTSKAGAKKSTKSKTSRAKSD
jgi:large subunit ribosomal protein L17